MSETTNYKLKKAELNETADIEFVNDNMDKIDALIYKLDTASETFGDVSAIYAKNVSVAVTAWAQDSTYAAFPFRAGIAVEGCTTDYIPNITFAVTDVLTGNFAPVAETYGGGVYIYAAEKPAAQITIPTIELLKKKEG